MTTRAGRSERTESTAVTSATFASATRVGATGGSCSGRAVSAAAACAPAEAAAAETGTSTDSSTSIPAASMHDSAQGVPHTTLRAWGRKTRDTRGDRIGVRVTEPPGPNGQSQRSRNGRSLPWVQNPRAAINASIQRYASVVRSTERREDRADATHEERAVTAVMVGVLKPPPPRV